jgi:hypothetical protein
MISHCGTELSTVEEDSLASTAVAQLEKRCFLGNPLPGLQRNCSQYNDTSYPFHHVDWSKTITFWQSLIFEINFSMIHFLQ